MIVHIANMYRVIFSELFYGKINQVLRRDMLRESVPAYGNKENSEKSED